MISEIKSGLDEIAVSIRTSKQQIATAKEILEAAVAGLQGLPTTHSEIISEIGDLGSDASDVLYKDELAKLTTEFQGVVASAQGAIGEI